MSTHEEVTETGSPEQQRSTIRLAGIVRESIVDGPGIRLTVFVQGCPHHCPGCHNPDTHDPSGGYDCDSQKIIEALQQNPLLRGVTLSGGEPIEQAEALLPMAEKVRELGKDIVIYSGYTFEQLQQMAKNRPAVGKLLSLACLLVDGRFISDQRDLTLRFRGSSNQRLLDPVASLEQGCAVLSNL